MLVSVIHSGFRDTQNRRLFEARMIFKHKTLHPGGLNTDFATNSRNLFILNVYTRALFSYQRVQITSNLKCWFWFERYITHTVFSCFLSTDEEAAASKRMKLTTPFRVNILRLPAKTQKQARAHPHVITTLNVIGWFKLHLWMRLAYCTVR